MLNLQFLIHNFLLFIKKEFYMKRSTKIFFRSFYISGIVAFCLLIGILGITKAYEGIRLIGFGEYRSAIEIDKGGIKIFDFTLKF